MWSFSTHGVTSGSSGLNGMASNSASGAPKDYGYPPTPPIDLKSSSDNQQHLQLQQHQQHQDYLHQDLSEAAAGLGQLPSLSSIEAKNNDHHLMSMFPSYSGSTSTSARKFHEGNGSMASVAASNYLSSNDQLPNVTSVTGSASTAYPYFTSPGVDLYSGYSAATSAASNNGTASSTGVFSSKTLQPSRPRSKSRANAGKTTVSLSTWTSLVKGGGGGGDLHARVRVM